MVNHSERSVLSHRPNHVGVFKDSGLNVKQYRYYDKKNINLDLTGMVEDIKVQFSYILSQNSLPRRAPLYCFMLVHTTQLVSTRRRINGK